jgi:hypothetical protein
MCCTVRSCMYCTVRSLMPCYCRPIEQLYMLYSTQLYVLYSTQLYVLYSTQSNALLLQTSWAVDSQFSCMETTLVLSAEDDWNIIETKSWFTVHNRTCSSDNDGLSIDFREAAYWNTNMCSVCSLITGSPRTRTHFYKRLALWVSFLHLSPCFVMWDFRLMPKFDVF